jgi:16S rRNA (guanine527-N7)-methyltransferase
LWIDIGTGAGLPGIVVAICRDEPVMLVEPRRLRTEFLNRAVAHLGLATQVMQMKVESLALPNAAVVISARAVGRLDALFNAAVHLADSATHWILPKGNSAEMEVESARKSWHGVFHVKPSISDPAAGIVHAHGVCRR